MKGRGEKEPDVFTESINVEPAILAQCVEHLEGISLDRTELDTKGVAFEEFMGGFFKGDFGQYFTPRDLIAFCVEMLQPARKDLVLDPGVRLRRLPAIRSRLRAPRGRPTVQARHSGALPVLARLRTTQCVWH